MSNRLAESISPYLRQHAQNPIDWWPWSPDAFAEARRRDVPILLSVGYAACHWCHVMAHESFEDPATAAVMNEHFVNIKVDREERPDVDAVYMAATQSLIGHGGWPMTVFLTPAGRPFYAGTYFPPTARHQMPAFTEVLGAIQQTWTTRRSEVDDASLRISEVVARQAIPSVSGVPDAALVERAARSLLGTEDHVDGGFGGAPKFPPSMDLEFLLRHAARRRLERAARPGDEAAQAGGGLTVEDDDSGDLALAAAGRSRGNVEWTELGMDNASLTPGSATFEFQLSLPPGRQATCTVRAVNDRMTEVGRKDVVLGPTDSGRLITLEASPRHAEVARANIARASQIAL